MDKEKFQLEHKAVLESLVEKTKFIYSEEFYALDEVDRKKYINDKMATEGHLNSLSSLLWAKTHQINSVPDIFPFLLLTQMFNNIGSSQPCALTTEPSVGTDKENAEQ